MERWRPIAGYEGAYEVSDQGRVRSLSRVIQCRDGKSRPLTGRVLRAVPSPRGGYLTVSLSSEGRPRTRTIHVLVAIAFHGFAPHGTECLHLNGNGHDNRALNLRWGTSAENSRDTVKHGSHFQASKTQCAKGHPYSAVNTRRDKTKNGGTQRSCRSCEADRRIDARARSTEGVTQ